MKIGKKIQKCLYEKFNIDIATKTISLSLWLITAVLLLVIVYSFAPGNIVDDSIPSEGELDAPVR